MMNPVEKRYRAFRDGIGPIKTRDDLLCPTIENRGDKAEPSAMYRGPKMNRGRHHGPVRLGVPVNHLPSQKVFRPAPKTPADKPKQHYQPKVHAMLQGEVPIKVWMLAEMERTGACHKTIYHWIHSGKYPNVTFRRVNARVVFVKEQP